MTFSIIPVFTIVLLVGPCVYTWITRDKDDNAGDYNNMDRSATWLYLAGTYTATLVSAVGMVGLPGQSYTTGYMYGLANWGSTIGLMLSALFFGPQIRKFGKTTVAEFFQFRFDSKAFRLIVAIITVLGTGAYFVSQTIGAAVILETIVGIPFNTTVIIVVVIVAYLALVGGAKTVTVTDTILFCVIAVALGVVFAPTVIGVAGGLPAMKILAGTTPEFLKLGGLANAPFGTMVGFIMLWALGIGAAPVNLSRAFLAKSNREWLKGMMVAFCVTVFMIWSVHSAAAYGRLINPDLTSGSQVMPWLALNAVPKAIGLAGVLGLVAACVSTADTQLLVIAQSSALDIWGHIKPDLDAKVAQKRTRIMVAIFAVAGAILSLGNSTFVVAFGNFGSSVFAAAFFPILTTALFNKRVTKAAAMVSMIVGIACDFVLHVIPMTMGMAWGTVSYLPYGIHPVIWSTAAAYIALFVVTALTKPTKQEIAAFDHAMAVQEPIDPNLSDSHMIKIAVGLLVFGAIFFAFVLYLSTCCVA